MATPKLKNYSTIIKRIGVNFTLRASLWGSPSSPPPSGTSILIIQGFSPHLNRFCPGVSISFYMIGNLGMETRPRRFSLPEAFFEGSRTDGREDCLSMLKSGKDGITGKDQIH